MTGQRRVLTIALVALAGGLAAVFLARFFMADGQDAMATPARARVQTGAVPATEVADVQLSRLNRSVPGLPEDGRDPFRYRSAPPPPKVVVPRAPVMLGPPEPLPPPPPPPVPPPPPIPLKFVGLVEMASKGGRVAVLSDSKGGVFYGKEGDIIDGRYRLLRVAADQAELAYTDGRGRQSLRLSGQ